MNIKILYLGWIPTAVFFSLIYLLYDKGNLFSNQIYFALSMGYIGGIIGNLLLFYVGSEVYYVDGFLDAIWKKFFWAYGPQIIGIIAAFMYARKLYAVDFNFSAVF